MKSFRGMAGLGSLMAPALSFTTFFAVLAWVVTHQVDRWIDSPTIEYAITKKRVGSDVPPAWDIRATVVNLSHKSTFRNAKFLFVARFDGKGMPLSTTFDVNEDHTEMIFHGPSLPEGRRLAKVQVPGAEFVIPVFAPGASVELVTRYTGSDEPRFVGAPSIEGSESFLLVERSPITFLVANEFWVMSAILALWFLVIVWFEFRNNKTSSAQIKSENAGNTNAAGAARKG